jgi:hypothetical protein
LEADPMQIEFFSCDEAGFYHLKNILLIRKFKFKE